MGGFAEAGAPDKAQQSTINVISENYAITMLLLIPVSAFSSYLAFKGTGYNYLEHFILIAFITGHQAILYSLVAIIGTAIDPDLAATISLFVSISFAYYVYWQFFEGTNRRTLIIPFLGSYLLFLILSAVVGTPLLMLALNYW